MSRDPPCSFDNGKDSSIGDAQCGRCAIRPVVQTHPGLAHRNVPAGVGSLPQTNANTNTNTNTNINTNTNTNASKTPRTIEHGGFWAVARAASSSNKPLHIIAGSSKSSKKCTQKMQKLKILDPSSITDKLTSNGPKIIKK